MINQALSNWISESESWQTFVDFRMPNIQDLPYEFLNRADDFYIALIGKLYDLLDEEIADKQELLTIGKGLEIYSLESKRERFYGVDFYENILLAAGLYYLADYSSSAYILSNLFKSENFSSEISAFILQFLQRKPSEENVYSRLILKFLNTGDSAAIEELQALINEGKNVAYNENPTAYTTYMIAEGVIKKFRLDNIWSDLLQHNVKEHWERYVEKTIKKSFPVWSFFPSQKIALERNILGNFKSVALQTPTSSGKTAICELIIYNEVQKNPEIKILYLAPFRALAAELRESFGKNLRRLGISSKTMYGGDMPTNTQKQLIQNISLLISTPEKFIALENSIKDFLDDFTLIICDEGHLLNDGNRGLHYELLLSRLKSNHNIERRFVFISALIPNIQRINEWLGGNDESVVRSTYRATELEYGFLKPTEGSSSYFLDVNPFKSEPQRYTLPNFLSDLDYQFETPKKVKIYTYSTGKTCAVTIALKSLNLGSVALFTPNKGGAVGVSGLANEVLKQINIGLPVPHPIDFIKPDSQVLPNLKEYCDIIFGSNYALSQLIQYGAVYHHGDLPQYVREVIEDAIRDEEIKLVICTNTLAEGVNLPIRTIVVYSTSRFDPVTKRLKDIDLRDLKNLVGRAGRAGKETKGLIVVVNPNDFGRIESVIKDMNMNDVTGYLFDIIRQITDQIALRNLQITNEVLEAQDEKFKELIDTIDISLIDLLSEEIGIEELTPTIESLINETFASFQSNDEQNAVLNNIINLRGQRIRPYVENNEFQYIKQSGTTLRLYKEINSIMDLSHPAWNELKTPVDDTWLNFIVDDNIAKLPVLIYHLADFNKINKTTITFSDVKEIIKSWIEGNWFDTLSGYFNGDVDITLRFINSFIIYHFQNACSAIIRIVQLKSAAPDFIPTHILNFPSYLSHGLNTTLKLNLLELGFNDRIGIIELAAVIDDTFDDDISLLEAFLINNKNFLLEILSGSIPNIVAKKLTQTFNYLAL